MLFLLLYLSVFSYVTGGLVFVQKQVSVFFRVQWKTKSTIGR